MFKRILISLGIFPATAVSAFAHLDPTEHGSLLAGLTHPLSGADHLLAMVAVGLWAAQVGGKARWVIPSAFVSVMAVGFALALAGALLPFVEPAILASVVGLGLLVALAVRLPLASSATIVGAFALFHGYAHGGELGTAAAARFGTGFVIATGILHAVGIGLGALAGRHQIIGRTLGALTVMGGAYLIFA
ncbi:HupE/UreJ family protein [Rhizobium sp. KVB221]|uniref:HupE/UreJ family protein n=1 Tax=Rhizobium setariae TaxID=2801340 RepID=A0A937CPP2_9HYPH|nr:HupE/UreJ family protein [Rhizobium setariae]MBL0372037.1 HupE/UreJ family protein [Rhizobium setariae]